MAAILMSGRSLEAELELEVEYTVKSVYNDHLMGYFSALWSSRRQTLLE